jgi:hypothetical protein
VVGDDAERRVFGHHASAVRPSRELSDPRQDPGKEVRVEVVVDSLEDRRDPLEPGSGVDRGLRQWRHRAGRVSLELHEDEIPDLERVVSGAVDEVGRVPREVFAPVVVELRARPAGAGVAHRPEVLLLAEAQDSRGRQVLLPELRGLVVVGVDGRPQPLRIQPVALVPVRDQLPCVGNGVGLEVVAEGEVAEHLEERVMASRVPDVVEIVVLAAGADALLGRRRAPVLRLSRPVKTSLN